MSYFYQAYGFNFSSDFKIDEMISGGDGKDISITLGKVPEKLNSPLIKGKTFEISKDETIITIKDIAKYYIAKGKTIVAEKLPDSTNQETKLFLLGIALGTLMHQRNELILHANVLNYNGKAIMLAGDSGAGKSTLTAMLLKKSLKLISDDIAIIRFNKQKYPMVYPGLPRIKLHIDSIKNLDIDKKNIVRLHNKTEKYNIPVSGQFYNNPLPVNKLFIIMPDNNKPFCITEIEGFKKFNFIKEYMYLKFLTDILWDQKNIFNVQSKLAANIKLAVINNPQDWSMNDNIINEIYHNCIT